MIAMIIAMMMMMIIITIIIIVVMMIAMAIMTLTVFTKNIFFINFSNDQIKNEIDSP